MTPGAPSPPDPDAPAAEILRLIRGSRLHDLPAVPATKPTLWQRLRRAPSSVSRGPAPIPWLQLAAAVIGHYWNEVAFDGLPNTGDPIKWRFGAWPDARTGYIGAVVMDHLEGDPGNPHRRELGILALKVDDSPGSGGARVPMFELFAQRTATTTADADMRRVATFSATEVVLWPPVRLMSGMVAGTLPPPELPPPVLPPPELPPPVLPPPLPPPGLQPIEYIHGYIAGSPALIAAFVLKYPEWDGDFRRFLAPGANQGDEKRAAAALNVDQAQWNTFAEAWRALQ